MKVLLLNYEYPPLGGGGGVFTAYLAEELARHHDVTVLTSDGFDLPRVRRERRVRVVRTPIAFRKRRSVASMSSMLAYVATGAILGRKLNSRLDFDVINTHFALPTGPLGEFLARTSRVPNVLTIIGGDMYDPSKSTSPHRHRSLRAVVRFLLERADLVTGDSRDTLTSMRRYYSRDVPAMRIPLGIPIPQLRGKTKSDIGFGERDKLLITVSRLVQRKAIEQLVDMMTFIPDPQTHLLVVGSGPLEAELRAQVARLGLQERVHFMGWIEGDPKYALLEAADIYVSSSLHEGFGLSYIEAMAARLPVVCYDRGGHTDFMSDGETGYLVPLNEVEPLADRVMYLLREAELRRSIGARNQRIARTYDIRTVAQEYDAALKLAVERRGLERVGMPHTARSARDAEAR